MSVVDPRRSLVDEVGAAESDAAAGARRNARLYFAGTGASLVGDSALSLVAGVWVKTLTGSSSQAGLVSACAYAATLAAPLAGVVADRLPRKRMLVCLNLAGALTVLPLLAVRARAETWIVFAVMAAYGLEATLIVPAEDALFAHMFALELRRRINGWRLTIQELGRLTAPLLGAGLFVALGGGAVAALDAATFVLAAVMITRLRVGDEQPARTEAHLRRELVAGIGHIWRTRSIRPVAIAATGVMALSGVGVAAQYSLVHGLGQRPAFLGVLSATLGAGSIVAALTANRVIVRFGERWLAVAGLLNFAAGDLLRASGWLPAAVVGSLVLGFALPYVFLATLNVAQRATPNELQGRVSAALTLALFGPQAPIQAAGSALIAQLSYAQIFVGSAVISAAIGVWLARAGDGA